MFLQRVRDAHEQKQRDALRRMTMNYIEQWNISGIVPSLNMVSGKTGYRGLEEIISIAKRIQTG